MTKKLIPTFLFLLLVCAMVPSMAQDTIIRYKRALVPNYINLQYAGNYGAYIAAAGYYLNHLHTLELVAGYGFTTRQKADKRIHNVFVKGIVVPATFDLQKGWMLAPQMGITISRQFSGAGNTFVTLPKSFPDGYYAPNAFRVHLNLGVRVRKHIKDYTFIKAIDFYAETTTNDLYVSYLLKSKEVQFRNIFSLALGINLIIFEKN
jgi:hypothetical protein